MDRRDFLKALCGGAALAAGGTLIAASSAEALVVNPGVTPLPEPAAEPAVATEADLAEARVENVWHYGRPHYWRYRRWRRRHWRRCWINRRGYRVCRW